MANQDKRTRHLPPLPTDLARHVETMMPKSLSERSNAGLVFWRYARVWDGNHNVHKAEERTKFLKDFVANYGDQKARQKDELSLLVKRMDRLAVGRNFIPTGAFVSGLGAEHPMENGFTFHPMLGVPWIPGSSVKGLVRAGAGLAEGEDSNTVAKLLGRGPQSDTVPLEQRGQSNATQGKASFLGALPTQWPTLAVDILTPHYSMYYADQAYEPAKRKRIASPIEAPKPVTFLVVAQTEFRFWIRGVDGEEAARVWGWLGLGLDLIGVGAKTAAGYGHMKEVQP